MKRPDLPWWLNSLTPSLLAALPLIAAVLIAILLVPLLALARWLF